MIEAEEMLSFGCGRQNGMKDKSKSGLGRKGSLAMNKLNLLLLPGLLNDARLWRDQVSKLSEMVTASVADLTGADSVTSLAAAGIHGSSLAILEECGHLSTLEQPEQVTDALREWLLRIQTF